MHRGSSTLACISVSLQLVTQHMMLAVELAHVVNTASEERRGIYNSDAVPEEKKNTLRDDRRSKEDNFQDSHQKSC